MKKLTLLLILISQIFFINKISAEVTDFKQVIYPITECNDGVDNDGNGFIDFQSDPNCSSWVDNLEAPDPVPSLPVPEPQPETVFEEEFTPILELPLALPKEDIKDLTAFEIEVANILNRLVWKPFGEVIGLNQAQINRNSINTIKYGLPAFTIAFAVLVIVPFVIVVFKKPK